MWPDAMNGIEAASPVTSAATIAGTSTLGVGLRIMSTATEAATSTAHAITTAAPRPPQPATTPLSTSSAARPTGPASADHVRNPQSVRIAWPTTSGPATRSAAEASAPINVLSR